MRTSTRDQQRRIVSSNPNQVSSPTEISSPPSYEKPEGNIRVKMEGTMLVIHKNGIYKSTIV